MTTIVGISADGSEDWSSEFLLQNDLPSTETFRRKSVIENLTPLLEGDIDLDEWDNIEDISKDSALFESNIISRKLSTASEESLTKTKSGDSNIVRRSLRRGPESSTKLVLLIDEKEDESSAASEDEDWDKELGVEKEIQESQESMANGFRHLMSETLGFEYHGVLDDYRNPVDNSTEIKTTIPSRCRVVNQLLQTPEEIKMVLYPKSIELYTLKMDGDRKQLMAVELDDWLRTVVTKHVSKIDHAVKLRSEIHWINKLQSKDAMIGVGLVKAWAEYVYILWKKNSTDICEALKRYYQILRAYSKMDRQNLKLLRELPETDLQCIYMHIETVLRITAEVEAKDCVTGIYNTVNKSRRNKYQFKIVFNSSNSSTNKPSSGPATLFVQLVHVSSLLFPSYIEHFALIELQAACNHICTMLQYRVNDIFSPSPLTLVKHYVTLHRSVSDSMTGLVGLTNKEQRKEKLARCDGVRSSVIVDLYFLLHGYNTLTSAFTPDLLSTVERLITEKNTLLNHTSASGSIYMAKGKRRSSFDQALSSSSSEEELEEDVDDEGEEGGGGNGALAPHDLQYAGSNNLDDSHYGKNDADMLSVSSLSTRNSSRRASKTLVESRSTRSIMTAQTPNTAMSADNILNNDNINKRDLLLMLRNDLNIFVNLLLPKYKTVSKRSSLKAKIAYVLGTITSTGISGAELESKSESIMLESLILVDKLHNYSGNDVAPPVISPFGILVLEKFGDLLVKNSKSKFGISCLESAAAAHILSYTREEKKIYRRLTSVSQECEDHKRSLYYHCILLKIAKDEGKLNEFVYIAELISKIFVNMAEFQLAERCVRIIALLHCGKPIQSVSFEQVIVAKMQFHTLPFNLEVPYMDITSENDTTPKIGLWGIRPSNGETFVVDSQQFASLLSLLDIFIVSNKIQIALHVCMILLKRRLPSNGRVSVLLVMATCYFKIRLLDRCEAALDRILYETDEALTVFTGRQSEIITADQFNLSAAGELEYKPIPRYSRALNELKRERQTPEKGGVDRMGTLNSASTSTTARVRITSTTSHGEGRSANMCGTLNSTSTASSALLGYISKVRSFQYLLLRVRSRLAANDPQWALRWIHVALTVCPRGKWDRIGRLQYLCGRANMVLCMQCRRGEGSVVPGKEEEEKHYAEVAADAYRVALTYYRRTDDFVRQTKAISRLVELHISRIFIDVAVNQTISLQDSLDGKGDEITRSVEHMSRMSLQLAGDTASPIPLLRTLINTAEIAHLQGNKKLCLSAWQEAKSFLTITYLQPLQFTDQAYAYWKSIVSKSSSSATSYTPQSIDENNNPFVDVPVCPVMHSPGLLIRIYDLMSRLMRLAFVQNPCPLAHENGGALLVSWSRLNSINSGHLESCLFSDSHTLHKSLEQLSTTFLGNRSKLSYFVSTPDLAQSRTSKRRTPKHKFGLPISIPSNNSASNRNSVAKGAVVNTDTVEVSTATAAPNFKQPTRRTLRTFGLIFSDYADHDIANHAWTANVVDDNRLPEMGDFERDDLNNELQRLPVNIANGREEYALRPVIALERKQISSHLYRVVIPSKYRSKKRNIKTVRELCLETIQGFSPISSVFKGRRLVKQRGESNSFEESKSGTESGSIPLQRSNTMQTNAADASDSLVYPDDDVELNADTIHVLRHVVNIMCPFEIIRKVMSVDIGSEVLCVEGVKAADDILRWIRASGKYAIQDPFGEQAKAIILRSTSPGLTLTSEGVLVNGLVDYSEAELSAKNMPDQTPLNPKELIQFLEKLNSADAASTKESLPTTLLPDIHVPLQVLGGSHLRAYYDEEQFTRLQGVHHAKSRQDILKELYEKGVISLTDYHKLNMETLRLLAQNNKITLPKHLEETVIGKEKSITGKISNPKKNSQTVSKVALARKLHKKSISNISALGADLGKGQILDITGSRNFNGPMNSMDLSLPHEKDGSFTSESSSLPDMWHLSSLYPSSFRFVVLIDNAIFVYSLFVGNTSVAVLRTSAIADIMTEKHNTKLVQRILPVNPYANFHLNLSKGSLHELNGDASAVSSIIHPEMKSELYADDNVMTDFAEFEGVDNIDATAHFEFAENSPLSTKMFDWSDAFSDAKGVTNVANREAAQPLSPPSMHRSGIGFAHRIDLNRKIVSNSESSKYTKLDSDGNIDDLHPSEKSATVTKSVDENTKEVGDSKILSSKYADDVDIGSTPLRHRGTSSFGSVVNMSTQFNDRITMPLEPQLGNLNKAGKAIGVSSSGKSSTADSLEVSNPNSWSETIVMNAINDIPKVHEEEEQVVDDLSEIDHALLVLMNRLGLQKIIFMLTALLHEESILFLISPGSEYELMQILTGLLRLLRPMKWQHIYIPYMLSSCDSIFQIVMKQQKPFLIGAYYDILRSYNTSTSLANYASNITYSDDIHLSNVTIVDVARGVIKPGKRLSFAAACIMNERLAPELNPSLLSDIVAETMPLNDLAAMYQKPAIPIRYRVQLYRRMYCIVNDITSPASCAQLNVQYNELVNNNLIISQLYQCVVTSNRRASSADRIHLDKALAVTNGLRQECLDIMVSLFKGLPCFVVPPKVSDVASASLQLGTAASGYANLSAQREIMLKKMFAVADSSVNSNEFVDERNLILFAKDDVKPLLQYLLHTKSFKCLAVEIYINDPKHGFSNSFTHSYFTNFLNCIRKSLLESCRIYQSLTSNRVAGHVITYFSTANTTEGEQQYPFLHQFPYHVTDVKSGHLFTMRKSETVKVKRRWCVLDARRLTYYKSRSTRRIKDYITMDPNSVRLVVSPSINEYANIPTVEGEACAIIYGNQVMVLRAENQPENVHWVQTLRARLLDVQTASVITKFYETCK